MTTSNAVADKNAALSGTEKAGDKLAEKRRALGRGLESLLPGPRAVVAPPPSDPVAAASEVVELQASAARPVSDADVIRLELDQIEQNPYQTRTEFEPRALSDLAASIQAQGVLQPIVVRPAPVRPVPLATGVVRAAGRDQFLLILGERRFRASKMAGMTTIPAIVKRVSDQQAAEMTLVENLQRQDLDCLDQAMAFAKLSTDFRLTQDDIGKRVGVSREQVSNYLRLLKLPAEVQLALRRKELSYSHARLLLSLENDDEITKVARLAIAKKMSVALLEQLVMASHGAAEGSKEPKEGAARWVDPNVRAAQRALETALGMRVRIRDRKGKGKITIEYGTLEDFDRVVGMLQGK
jgi:ParB family transcriptional regulator, chromosome partitioning protein